MTNFTIKKIESLKGIGYSVIHSTLLPELKRLNKSEIVCLIIMNYLHDFKDQNFSYYNIGIAFDIKYDTIKAGFEGLQEKNIITIEDNLVALNSKYFNEKNLVEKKIFESIVNNTKNSIGDRLEDLNKKMGEALKIGDTELALKINDEILLLSKSIKNPKSKKETTTIEVEKTQKETVLDVKEEIEHKATTSTPEAEETAKTEQKEVIKEDTSNDTEVDNNEEDENKLKMENNKTENLMNKLLELDNSNVSVKDKVEKINIKVKSWLIENKKYYSNPFYCQEALNNYLQSEIDNIIENNKTYNSLPETTEEEKTEINGEYEIENSYDKYAKALEILHSKYVSDKISKEYITKEFNEFFEFGMEKTQANIIQVYKNLKYKFEKNMVKDIPTPAPEEQKEAVLDVVKEIQVKDTPETKEAEKTALNGIEKYKNLFEAARMEALKTEENNEEVTRFFDNII